MDIKKLSDDVKTSLRSAFTINSVPQCINELVLNSLDAKSTLIAVRINLHTFRLQVVDNGIGIEEHNLGSTGMRYHTTKCHTFRDYKNNSKYYGYKGETFASIIDTCKKLLISTRCPESNTSFCKTFENKSSTIINVKNRPSSGTTVTVEDFMFNLPVRQNRVNIELDLNEIKQNLEMLSIMNPNVSFSLRNDINKKTLYKNDKVDSVEKALIAIYKDIEPNSLSHIKIKHGKISVAALIYTKLLAKHQIIYVNKRYVHCENLQNHINKILLNSLMSKDTNYNFVYVINIKCPYSHIDLTNMNKVTVEFRNWETILKLVDKLLMKFLGKENLEAAQEKTPQMVEAVQKQIRLSNMKGMCKATAVKRKITRNCEIISRSVSEVRSVKITCSNKKIKLSEECLAEVPDVIGDGRTIRENFKRNFDENLKSRKFNKNMLCVKNKKPNLIQVNEGNIALDETKNNDCDELMNNFKKPKRKQTPCFAKFNKIDTIEVNTDYNTMFNQRLITIDDVDNQVVGKAVVMDKFLKSLNYCKSRLDKTTTVSMSVKIRSQKTIRQIQCERENTKRNIYLQSNEEQNRIFNFTFMKDCDKFKSNQIFNDNESILNYRVILKEPNMLNKLDISLTKCEEPRNKRFDLNSITFEKRTRYQDQRNFNFLSTTFSQLRDFNNENLPSKKNRDRCKNYFEFANDQSEESLPWMKNWYASENNVTFDNGLNLNQMRSHEERCNFISNYEYKNDCLPNRFEFSNNLNLNRAEFNEKMKEPNFCSEQNSARFKRNKSKFADVNEIDTNFRADKPYNPIFGKFIEPGDRDEPPKRDKEDGHLEQHINFRNFIKSAYDYHNEEPNSPDYFCFNRNQNKLYENSKNCNKMPKNCSDRNIFDQPDNNIFNYQKTENTHSNLVPGPILQNKNGICKPNFGGLENVNKFLNYDNLSGTTNLNKLILENRNRNKKYGRNYNLNTVHHATKPKHYYNNTIDSFLKDEVRNIYNDREIKLENKHRNLPNNLIFQNIETSPFWNAELLKRDVKKFNGAFNFDNGDNEQNLQRDPKLKSVLYNPFKTKNRAFKYLNSEDPNINCNRLKRDVEAFKEQNRFFDFDPRENLQSNLFQTDDLNTNQNSEPFKRDVEKFKMKNRMFDVENKAQNFNRNPKHDLCNRQSYKMRHFNQKDVQNFKENFISTNNEMDPHVNFEAGLKWGNFESNINFPQKLSAENYNKINSTCDLFKTEIEAFKMTKPSFDFEDKTIFPSYQSHSHSNQCNPPFSMQTDERLMNLETNNDFINEAPNLNTQDVRRIHKLQDVFQFPISNLIGKVDSPKIMDKNENVFNNNPISKVQTCKQHLEDRPSSKPNRKQARITTKNRNVRNQITQTGKSLKLQQVIAIKNVLERRRYLKEPKPCTILKEDCVNPKFCQQNAKSEANIVPKLNNVIHKRKLNQKLQKHFNKKANAKNDVNFERKLPINLYENAVLNHEDKLKTSQSHPTEAKMNKKLKKGLKDNQINRHIKPLKETNTNKKLKRKNKQSSPLIKPRKLSKPIPMAKFTKNDAKNGPNPIKNDQNKTHKKPEIKIISDIQIFPKYIVKDNVDIDCNTSKISETPEMKSFAKLNLENSNSNRSFQLLDSECSENKTREDTFESIFVEQNVNYAKKLEENAKKRLEETSKPITPKHCLQSLNITNVSLVKQDCNKKLNFRESSLESKRQDIINDACKEHSGLSKQQSCNNEKSFDLNGTTKEIGFKTKIESSSSLFDNAIFDACKEHSGLSKQSCNNEKFFDLNDTSKEIGFKTKMESLFDDAIFDEKLSADRNEETITSKLKTQHFWQDPNVNEMALSQKSLKDKSQNLCNITFQKISDTSPLLEQDKQRNIKSTMAKPKLESNSEFWDKSNCVVDNLNSQNTQNKKSFHSQKLCDKQRNIKSTEAKHKLESNSEFWDKSNCVVDNLNSQNKKSFHSQKLYDKQRNIKSTEAKHKLESNSEFWDKSNCVVDNLNSQNTQNKNTFHSQKCDITFDKVIEKSFILSKEDYKKSSQTKRLDFWNSQNVVTEKTSDKTLFENNQKSSVKLSPIKSQKLCNNTFDKLCDKTPVIKKENSKICESQLKSQRNSLFLLDTIKSNKLQPERLSLFERESDKLELESSLHKKKISQKNSLDFLNINTSSNKIQKLCNSTFEKISDKSPSNKELASKPQRLHFDKSSSKLLSDETLFNNTFEKITDKVEGLKPESQSNPLLFLDSPRTSKRHKSSQIFIKESSSLNKTQKLFNFSFQKLPSFDLFDDVGKNISENNVDGNIFHNISEIVDFNSFNFIKHQENNEFSKDYRNITDISLNPVEEIDKVQTEGNSTLKHTWQKHEMTKSEILEFENNDLLFPNCTQQIKRNSNHGTTKSCKSQSQKISSEMIISLSEGEKNELLENELKVKILQKETEDENIGQNEWVPNIDPDGNKFYVNLRSGMTMYQNFNDSSKFKVKERIEFVPKGLSPILSGTPIKKVALSLSGKMKLYKAIAESYQNELGTIKWQQIINNKDPKAFFNEIYKKCHKKSNLEMLNVHKGPYFTIFKTLNSNVFTNKIFDDIHVVGQWDKKFIVTLAKTKTLLLLFDQHAVHERIRVEKLYSEYTIQEESNVQYKKSTLNFTIKLNLSSTEINLLSRYKLIFEKYGLKYQVDDKDNIVKIKEIPTCLLNKTKNDKHHEKLKELVVALIEEEIHIIQSTKGATCKEPNLIRDTINSEACRGAVMFGDNLTLDECKKLIKDLSVCNLPFQCAHGRPTLAPIIDLRSTDNLVSKVNLKNL